MSRREIRESQKRKRKLRVIIFLIILILMIIIISFGKFKKQGTGSGDKKVIDTSVLEEQIYYSLIEDEDQNNIKILFTIKSNDGIRKVALPDGSIHEYDNEKEVKIDYVVERNGEYIIQVTDSNGTVAQKNIKVTVINEWYLQNIL